jgi:hypothetical protein
LKEKKRGLNSKENSARGANSIVQPNSYKHAGEGSSNKEWLQVESAIGPKREEKRDRLSEYENFIKMMQNTSKWSLTIIVQYQIVIWYERSLIFLILLNHLSFLFDFLLVVIFLILLNLVLEVIDKIFGLPESVDESIVDNQLSYILELLPDFISGLVSPALILAFLFLHLIQLSFVCVLHLLVSLFELGHKSFLDAVDDCNHFFGSVGNVIVLFRCFFQEI